PHGAAPKPTPSWAQPVSWTNVQRHTHPHAHTPIHLRRRHRSAAAAHHLSEASHLLSSPLLPLATLTTRGHATPHARDTTSAELLLLAVAPSQRPASRRDPACGSARGRPCPSQVRFPWAVALRFFLSLWRIVVRAAWGIGELDAA
ncbi:hypothetical protein E2562_000053, partial [Oryza meyeriana var. granulata]